MLLFILIGFEHFGALNRIQIAIVILEKIYKFFQLSLLLEGFLYLSAPDFRIVPQIHNHELQLRKQLCYFSIRYVSNRIHLSKIYFEIFYL